MDEARMAMHLLMMRNTIFSGSEYLHLQDQYLPFSISSQTILLTKSQELTLAISPSKSFMLGPKFPYSCILSP